MCLRLARPRPTSPWAEMWDSYLTSRLFTSVHLKMEGVADKAEALVTKKASEEGPVVLVFVQSSHSPRPALLQEDEGEGLWEEEGWGLVTLRPSSPDPAKTRVLRYFVEGRRICTGQLRGAQGQEPGGSFSSVIFLSAASRSD